MRWGINLRGDLAKLSDVEIADMLEALIIDRQATYDSTVWVVDDLKRLYYWFGRGPLHSRIFYKLACGYIGPFKSRFGELYLLDCEVKDVRDEIERRVKSRRSAARVT